MQISVIICTWNRSQSLRRTLQSLCALEIPTAVEWELVVVDNNSTDDTARTVTAFENHLPLRAVREKQLGLSRARNTGVAHSRGDLLLFTDDDVECDSGWLHAHSEAAARWPQALYFGGVVTPKYTGRVPVWIARNRASLYGMLGECDFGPQERVLALHETPFGPNMALRRAAFESVVFNEQVGRKGTEQLRGSESSALLALAAAGATGVWVPAARVRHVIPPQHATVCYLWNYYFGNGRTAARLGRAHPDQSRRRLALAFAKAVARTGRQPRHWTEPLAHIARLSGQFYETRALRRANVGSSSAGSTLDLERKR